ncbi:hypothetical protein GCM10023319_62620 [Nocardia iowensis]
MQYTNYQRDKGHAENEVARQTPPPGSERVPRDGDQVYSRRGRHRTPRLLEHQRCHLPGEIVIQIYSGT